MALTAYYHLLHNIKRALKCTKYLYTKETGRIFFNAITFDSSTLVTKWFNLKRRENVLRKEHISVEQYIQYIKPIKCPNYQGSICIKWLEKHYAMITFVHSKSYKLNPNIHGNNVEIFY